MLTVPALGAFAADIVGWDETGVLSNQSPLRIALADKPPHFALRIKPRGEADFPRRVLEELLGQLAVTLTKNFDPKLSIRRIGPPRTGRVLEGGAIETVRVVPYEIQGLAAWQLRSRESVRVCKVVARLGGESGFAEGTYVAKDLLILNPLHRPDIGPGAATADLEPEPRGAESEFAQAHVFLDGMTGIRSAGIRFYSGDRELPVTVRGLGLTMGGKQIEIPSSAPLTNALLSYTAFVGPGWWSLRHDLVVEFEVWDDLGKRHVLRWKPQLD